MIRLFRRRFSGALLMSETIERDFAIKTQVSFFISNLEPRSCNNILQK